jgi:4-aminobutyrate aminotransferase / (S)-3-amino-2-methylpropionate transaminase / 5-aminovalerate transaminase
MRALRALTERHGIVLIVDEIQTGFGRTGQMFGFEHSGIQPDLVTVAKSLAGGLPLSGVVGKTGIMDAPLPGGLGGTYGGNPLACLRKQGEQGSSKAAPHVLPIGRGFLRSRKALR